MCIAILKPNDKVLDKELLQTCSVNNPDGCGFAYVNDNGDIIINKFMLFKDFWEEYSKVQENKTMLIHFRIATHGNVEIQNCHPFKLNDRMALIHNGIISGYGSRKDNLSDTRDFIEKVIGNISHKMWKNPAFRELVGNAIGYSKFAILDIHNNYYIINEHKGSWKNGVWFSNDSYKTRKVYSSVSKNTTGTESVSNVKVVSTSPSTTKSSWNYIMYCPSCDKEYDTEYWYQDVCPECKCKLEQVGWKHNDNKTYYGGYNLKKKKKEDCIDYYTEYTSYPYQDSMVY